MSKAGGKSGGRTMTDAEASLWAHATRTLEPIKAKARVASKASDEAAALPRTESRPKPPPAVRAEPRDARPSASAQPQSRPPPAIADFDRRKARQIASGKIEVDASIDLHGLRQQDARASLRAFLLRARADGCRTVLVVTGKGGDAGSSDALGALMGERPRGVLRRSVPLWLEEPDMRAVVVSYTRAGPRHGGAGALYVQLRKGPR